MIDEVKIENVKGLKSAHIKELKDVNYLVGPNGSGKSTVLEVLRTLSMVKPFGQGRTVAVEGFSRNDLIFREGNSFEAISSPTLGQKVHTKISFIVQDNRVGTSPLSGEYIEPEAVKGQGAGFPIEAVYFSNGTNTIDNVDGVAFSVSRNYDKDSMSGTVMNSDSLKTFLTDNYCKKDESIDIIYRDIDSLGTSRLRVIKKSDRNKVVGDISLRGLSAGYHNLIGLYFNILSNVQGFKDNSAYCLALVEEPEESLHPNIQKKIPEILENISKEYGVQFFVATHSPFVISAAVEKQQKVYLFDDGESVDLKRKPAVTSGYHGPNCLSVVAKMLGAGLDDLNAKSRRMSSKVIVFCEGSENAEYRNDAELYAHIFKDYPDYEFLSCGNAAEVVLSYYQALPVAPLLYGDGVECRAIVDRSFSRGAGLWTEEGYIQTGEGKVLFDDNERKRWLGQSPDYRMLRRKEIENYLFDPLVVACLKTSDQKLIETCFTQKPSDYQGGEVKDYLKKSAQTNRSLYLRLSEAIYVNRKSATKVIYNELNDCLMGKI